MAETQDILVVEGCGCGCCDPVELHTEHQPDVLLLDEFTETYANDIVHTREAVDDIKETLDTEDDKLDSIKTTGEDTNAVAKEVKEIVQHLSIDSYEEATSQEVIDMFSGVLTSDGYMHVREGWVDSEGYMHANYRETADNYVTF